MVDGVSARVRAAAEKSPSSATWTKTAMSRNSTAGLLPVLICENPSQQVGRQVCRSRRVLLSKCRGERIIKPEVTMTTLPKTSPVETISEKPALDTSKVAYQLPQPTGMMPDIFSAGVLDLDGGDERDWVPQSDDVSFKPLVLSVSQGYYVNILRVRSSGILSRHRHSGPVHAITLRGKWHYLEHDWVATAGDYAFEPPGETHTLVVPEGVEEMATLFHVTGGGTPPSPEWEGARPQGGVAQPLESGRPYQPHWRARGGI